MLCVIRCNLLLILCLSVWFSSFTSQHGVADVPSFSLILMLALNFPSVGGIFYLATGLIYKTKLVVNSFFLLCNRMQPKAT